MTLEEVAKKLGKSLVIQYNPRREKEPDRLELEPNPTPWLVRRYDYSNITGVGATHDEAAADLVRKILASAAESAQQAAESLGRAEEYRRELAKDFGL